MKKFLIAVGLLLALGLLAGCAKEEPVEEVDPVEAAWSDFGDTYYALADEDIEAKAALMEAFVREHPDTEYAGRLAGGIAYYRGESLGDPAAAYALLNETYGTNTDPETRFELGKAMFPLALELGEPADLDAIAQDLAASRELDFGEMIDVADLAVEHEQWATGAKYAEAALAKATPEAFLADYPDDDYTPEEAAAKADRRKAMSYADLGWALHNMGETDKAMAAFEAGAPLKTVDYLGVADTSIDLYLGKVKLDAGDADGAITLLSPAAIMGSNDDAMAALREAYATVKGNDDGIDEWMWSQREALGKPIDAFTLADYEGNEHDFSALSDGKVTLLAFWFPT